MKHVLSMSALMITFIVSSIAGAKTFRHRLDRLVDKLFVNEQRSGVILVSDRKNALIYTRGERDINRQIENTSDSIFLTASSAKHVTAAAILRLVDQGLLSVDMPIAKLLPELDRCQLEGDGQKVTIHHLLNHTSGIPEAYAEASISRRLFQERLSFRDFLQAVQCQPLKFIPGTRFEYSNTGYILLGEIVRRASGLSFSQFIDQELFKPFGIKNTMVGRPERKGTVAYSYTRDRQGRKVDYLRFNKIRVRHDSEIYTDGNIYSNIKDFSLWLEKLASGKVLSKDSTRRMFKPYVASYGYGWDVSQMKGESVYSHEGEWIGYESAIAYLPQRHQTIIVFLNYGRVSGILDQILELVMKP
jgi:CubicO group peptidase (beta-lactamase class C family)